MPSIHQRPHGNTEAQPTKDSAPDNSVSTAKFLGILAFIGLLVAAAGGALIGGIFKIFGANFIKIFGIVGTSIFLGEIALAIFLRSMLKKDDDEK